MRYSWLMSVIVSLMILTSCRQELEKQTTSVNRPAKQAVQPDLGKAGAAITVISPDGSKLPCASVQAALDAAKTGDLVLLQPGVYRGRVNFRNGGVTLRGVAGAVVNGNVASWQPKWRPEPTYGKNAYSAAIPFVPVTMTVDDRVMIDIRASRAGEALGLVHSEGVGRNGRGPLGGLFTYLSKEKRVLVSFADASNPESHKIEAAEDGCAAVDIEGADNCIVENLIITGGKAGVRFSNTKGSIVRNCLIYSVDDCVSLNKGAESCKVLACDLTMNPDGCSFNNNLETGLPGGDVWNAHKHYGTYDKNGVFLDSTGSNHEVAGNYMYDVWNGITNGCGISPERTREYYENYVFKNKPRFNLGLSVHHNRIDLTLDDALEPNGEVSDNRWNSNYVTRAHCAARLKTLAIGPFYFYDNVLTDSHDGMRFYKSTPEQATVYIYHNVINYDAGVIYHAVDNVAWSDSWLKKHLKRGTPGFYVYNNIFLCHVPLSNRSDVTPNYHADYNLYTCQANPDLLKLGLDQHSIFGKEPVFAGRKAGNWGLKAGSPGKHAGMDLSNFKVSLPGCEKGYFTGNLPDMGRLTLTPAQTPTGPISGLWQVASKTIDLGEKDVSSFELRPLRWVKGSKVTFVCKGKVRGGKVRLIRSGSPSEYTIRLTDESGRKLTEKRVDSKVGYLATALTIPGSVKPGEQVRLEIDAKRSGELRVEVSEGMKVGFVADKVTPINKYDGGAYVLEYPVPVGTKSFTVLPKSRYGGHSRTTVVDPTGNEMQLDSSGLVLTDHAAGTYTIKFEFTKKAEVSVKGPGNVLFLAEQPSAKTQPHWPKPKF